MDRRFFFVAKKGQTDRRLFFGRKKRTDGQTFFLVAKKGQTDRRFFWSNERIFFFHENTNARHLRACGKYTQYRPNQPKNPKTLIVNVFRTPILVYQLSARVNIAQEVHKRIQFVSHLFTSNV